MIKKDNKNQKEKETLKIIQISYL